MTTVYIVEDEPLLREMVVEFVNEVEGIEIIGQCGDGLAAIDGILASRPDIVITDLILPRANGFQVFEAVRKEDSGMRFLVFTGSITADRVRQALDLGVDGFIEKTRGIVEFENALQAIASGGSYYSTRILAAVRQLRNEPQSGS